MEREAKKRNPSRREEEEEDDSCSSAVSSPLREPYMPVEVERRPDGSEIRKPVDTEVSSAYKDMQAIYYKKIGLPFKPLDLSSCFEAPFPRRIPYYHVGRTNIQSIRSF
jgi:hypothetical protein